MIFYNEQYDLCGMFWEFCLHKSWAIFYFSGQEQAQGLKILRIKSGLSQVKQASQKWHW